MDIIEEVSNVKLVADLCHWQGAVQCTASEHIIHMRKIKIIWEKLLEYGSLMVITINDLDKWLQHNIKETERANVCQIQLKMQE